MTEEVELIEHDKSNWGSGPWQQEEDRMEWRHNGLPCLMVRNSLGAWCGYVGVTKKHPFFQIDHDKAHDIRIHGGLTYSAKCHGHICHIPKKGEDGDVWWLGFDCGHAQDLSPGHEAQMRKIMRGRHLMKGFHNVYRDVAYVKHQVNSLADQLLKVAQ